MSTPTSDVTADVVIGAASGVGLAVAHRFAPTSDHLVIADISEERAAHAASELGAHASSIGCDISDPRSVEAVASLAGDVGRLVLTAGLSPTMASGSRIMEVNAAGPQIVLDAFLPAARAGSVAVVFSSIAGHMAPSDAERDAVFSSRAPAEFDHALRDLGHDVDDPNNAYILSKVAVQVIARRQAIAWGSRGARVVSVSPGVVDTPMGRAEHEAEPYVAQMVAGSPLGRDLRPDEVASVVEFLCSSHASGITGTDVRVDGGVVAALG